MATTDDGSVGLSQNADPAILQYQNRPERMPQFMGTAVGPAATPAATPAPTTPAPAVRMRDGKERPLTPEQIARQEARKAARLGAMGAQPATRLGSMNADGDSIGSNDSRASRMAQAPVPGPNTMGLPASGQYQGNGLTASWDGGRFQASGSIPDWK